MCAEQEAKFHVHDCRVVEYCLRTVGQLRRPWHFEFNALYDRGQELLTRGHLLRLRVTDHAVLTFKEPLSGPGIPGVKAMREIECRVDSALDMHLILRGVGFSRSRRYEKFRSVWDLGTARIYLDIVPIGHFVEIEAEPEEIVRTAAALGLDSAQASDASYHALHRDWLLTQDLAPDEDMLFREENKHQWARVLGCALDM